VTKTVLLVEDDDRQREAATRFLGADGVNVVAVATAGDALAELRATSFDCVVVDLMLPGMSGFELLDEMSRDGHEAPAIVYTARPLDLDDEQRLRRHSRCIIVKGAHSPDRLREEVRRALEGEGPAKERPRVDGVARDREAVFVGRRVLLAEDDVRSVFALMSLLEAKGARVEVARNGNEALARVGREPPIDVVLMDVMMPVMDGLTAIREIRKNDGLAKLPIIALTAKAMPDDRQACLAAGANDYVMKPIDVERLLSLLRVWLPT
jgi:CheY-like chemotaxis protein